MDAEEVADIEEAPAPKARGRPRKLPEPEPVVEEPARKGRPRKLPEPEPLVEEEVEPVPKAKGRTRKPRDPSQMEPTKVTIQTSRGERSFDALRPKRPPPPEQPQQPHPQQPPERGRFWAMHHQPSHSRPCRASWRPGDEGHAGRGRRFPCTDRK